jgi:hypothetical protein
MRKFILLSTITLLAACSQRDASRSDESLKTFDVEDRAEAPPGVGVTAAPGVAFNYRYAFRLPNNRIAQVQEAHATACEKLGLDRCRITGMRYRLVDQKDIQAMLSLRLDPALARDFGKQATDAVAKSDGMLVDQEITGEDVGTRIAATNKSESELRAELAKVEAELARPVPMIRGNVAPQAAVDRQSLLNRAEELRGQIRSLQGSRDADEKALAGTPMVFTYGSGSVVPGFDVRSPIKDALQRAADNFMGGLLAILVIVITLLPWIVLAGLVFWLYRSARRRWNWMSGGYRREDGSDDETAPRTEPAGARRRTPEA